MSRIRWAVATAAAVGLAAVGIQAAPDPAGRQALGEVRPVSSAVLVCPELEVTSDSAGVATAAVTPGASDSGTATLRAIDSGQDLARITEPGDPLALLVAARSAPPLALSATGAWAPGASAGVLTRELEGAAAGAASAACPAPRAQWWFVGTGSQLGRGAALLVANPSREPARFDVSLNARGGPVQGLGSKGIDLGPGSWVRLRLEALAPDEELLSVHVSATSGRVSAVLRDVVVPRRGAPRGVDFIPPAVPPATQLHVTGIPGGRGARELVLVNPGTGFATVRPRLLTKAGPAELAGQEAVAVPAGSVVSVALDEALDGTAATLELVSDLPVTGGVRSSFGRSRRDISWLSAAPAVAAPTPTAAATGLGAGPGVRTRVTVAAPAGEVRGTLTVIRTGRGRQALLGPDGAAADPGEAIRGKGRTRAGRVLTAASRVADPIDVTVPAESQEVVVVPGTDRADLVSLVWQSAPGTGPALLSHTTRADGPLATGFPWWPITSVVGVTAVREDLGVLDPVR